MKTAEGKGIPEFKTLEEERRYWEARGPLAEGHKGRVSRPKPGQKRSSSLAVRLSGEELTRLRDAAAQYGVGPSTFARIVLTSALQHQGRMPRRVSLDELRALLEASLPQAAKERTEALARTAAAGNPDEPTLIILDASQEQAWEEFTLSLLKAVLAIAGGQVITPEHEGYQKAREALESAGR